MFEDDDDDDLGYSEAEIWYDDNLRYFDWQNKPTPGLPLDVELFYHSVYVPFKQDMKKPIREIIYQRYPRIATEHRPEVLEKIEKRIDWVGHEFILFLHDMVEEWKTGKDLSKIFPELSKSAAYCSKYRKPRYVDPSPLDRVNWLTDEQRQSMIQEIEHEEDVTQIYGEDGVFDFYRLLQDLAFKHYRGLKELYDDDAKTDADGCTMLWTFLLDEYNNYRIDFGHYDEFIEYGFEVEDLNLPYKEYIAKLTEKIEIQNEKLRKEEENEKNEL